MPIIKAKHGHHPNSKANLDPQANSKGGRSRKALNLSDEAMSGLGMFAQKAGLEWGGKPNNSEAANLLFEALLFTLSSGGTLTVLPNGQIEMKKEKL